MHPTKIDNIIGLGVDDRYQYSVREIAKLGRVWVIATLDSWVTFVDKDGDEIFPIWPHKEVAEICAFEELRVEGYLVQDIDYEKFKNRCIPDMIKLNILFGVFYDLTKEAYVLHGGHLLEDIESELE